MRTVERSYIAGLFDGEGCVSIYRAGKPYGNNYRYELLVFISNNYREPIDWLYKVFGGCIKTRYANIEKNWRTNYIWRLNSNQAASFLKIIEPYLRIKHEQAKLAINFQKNRKQTKCRFARRTEKETIFMEDCWGKMKLLNNDNRPHAKPTATTERRDLNDSEEATV